MNVAWLGESHVYEPAVVGGKEASLSRLAAEYRVPTGFALQAKALGLAAPDLARGVVPEPLRTHIAAAYATLLRDDQLVEVDGTNGSVRIVEA